MGNGGDRKRPSARARRRAIADRRMMRHWIFKEMPGILFEGEFDILLSNWHETAARFGQGACGVETEG